MSYIMYIYLCFPELRDNRLTKSWNLSEPDLSYLLWLMNFLALSWSFRYTAQAKELSSWLSLTESCLPGTDWGRVCSQKRHTRVEWKDKAGDRHTRTWKSASQRWPRLYPIFNNGFLKVALVTVVLLSEAGAEVLIIVTQLTDRILLSLHEATEETQVTWCLFGNFPPSCSLY